MTVFEVEKEFTARTPEGVFTLRKGQKIRLLEAEAVPLILEGLIKPAGDAGKPDADRDETADPFAETFKEAVEGLSRQYIEGTINYIREHHPDLYQQTIAQEDKLNEVWIAGREGKASIEEFRKVVEEWYLLHLRGIEIYANSREKTGSAVQGGQIKRPVYKIYSKLLDSYLWIVETEADMHALKAREATTEAIYTYDEIGRLKGLSKSALQAIHMTKKTFPGSIVEQTKPREGGKKAE